MKIMLFLLVVLGITYGIYTNDYAYILKLFGNCIISLIAGYFTIILLTYITYKFIFI